VTARRQLRYFGGMERWIRDGSGLILLLSALGLLFYGVVELRQRDYLACAILTLTGLSLMRAGVELLRASVGE
jgi:hypothetical protein